MNYSKFKEAIEKIKHADPKGARDIYKDIKENTDTSRKAFCSSLDFMIDMLGRRSELVSDDAFLNMKEGKESITSNNVILLINPSHAHELENEFWKSFIAESKLKGFEVVELAFRNVTPFADNITVVNPARAVDLAKKYANFKNHCMPKWFDDNLLNHYSDWEHRRWQLGKYQPAVKIGIMNTAKYIDAFVKSIKPSMIITTNKIDWPNNFGFLAAKYYGVNYHFIERSPLDSHIVENIGMFSESQRIERLIFDSNVELNKTATETSQSLIRSLTTNPYGFRAEHRHVIF